MGNYVRVSWCGVMSDYFLAVNGVKQGGVLSPVLFCVYIDGLLVALSKAGVGCFIGSNFVGALAYADDVVLLAPTATALRRMLSICDCYASEYCISFNAIKSKCLVFLPNSRRFLRQQLNECTFYVGNKPIEYVTSYSHLGHIITSLMDDDADLVKRRSDFVGQVNNVLCYFGKVNSLVKNRLFHNYCTSMYGCELWSLNTDRINDLSIAWRKGLRRVWGVPYDTHCYLLPLISQCLPVFDEICRRSMNFITACCTHTSVLVRSVANHGLIARYNSFIGQNALFCTQRYKCTFDDIYCRRSNDLVNRYFYGLNDETQLRTAGFLSELISVRDGTLELSNEFNISREELNVIISHVCTQ